MTSLSFLLVGKTHADHFDEAFSYYRRRLLKYAKVETSFLKEEKLPIDPSPSQVEKALDEEGKRIEKAVPKSSFLILADLRGKEYDSPSFARALCPAIENFASLSFVVGSSYGLSDRVRKKAKMLWRLSELTYSHPLAMEVVMEQVYRAFKILRGEAYQK